jgi:WD40 repeat protein
MSVEKRRFNACLANYFLVQPLFFDGDLQKKPHIRKCVELPFQQTKAELWDEITETLCNLDLIQAKACAKMTYDLVKDFNDVLEVIPDNAENIRQEKERLARMDKYTRDLIACARGEISVIDIPHSIIPWPQEKIDFEIERIKNKPTRLDRIKDFYNFLGQESANLEGYASEFPYFAYQQAWNYADDGLVIKSIKHHFEQHDKQLILYSHSSRPQWNPIPSIVKILVGHKNSVNANSITPDCRYAISGSDDGSLILWDLKNGKIIRNLSGHRDAIHSVCITPDGKTALSGSGFLYRSLLKWDLDTGKSQEQKLIFAEKFTSVNITSDGKHSLTISAGNEDLTLRDLETGRSKRFKGNTGNIISISITPDFKYAISGNGNKTITLWDLKSEKVIRTIDLTDEIVYLLSISADGEKALSCSGIPDYSVKVWDLKTGLCVKILTGHKSRVNSVCISADGKKAVTCSSDQSLILWDLTSGQIIRKFTGHIDPVKSLSISPDGKYALSGSDFFGRILILWDLEKGKSIKQSTIHSKRVTDICITPDYKLGVSSSDDKTLILWNVALKQKVSTLYIHPNRLCSVNITPDCSNLIIGTIDQGLIFRSFENLKPLERHIGQTDLFAKVSLTPDGKYAFYNLNETKIVLTDIDLGGQIKEFIGHSDKIGAVAIVPDGKLAVSGGLDKSLIIWNIRTENKVNSLSGHSDWIHCLCISPNGKYIVSGSRDSTVKVWDLQSGQLIKTLNGHSSSISSVIFCPNGEYIISSSADRSIIIWNLYTSKKIARFSSSEIPGRIVIYPDGLIYGDEIGNVKFLNFNFGCFCSGIVTIRRIWDYLMKIYISNTADCPLCGHRFAPPSSIMSTIDNITKKAGLRPDQSPCLELPDEAWEDPGLLGNCPKCGAELKFNPFIAGGDI